MPEQNFDLENHDEIEPLNNDIETCSTDSGFVREIGKTDDRESPGSTDSKESSDSNDSDRSSKSLLKQKDQSEDVERQCTDDVTYNLPNENTDDNNTFWKKVLVIFSILDLLLIITIFVIRFGIHDRDGSDIPTSVYGHCLNCTDVYLTKDDFIDNIYHFNISEKGECCSNNQTYIIQKYVLKRYRSDQAKASSKQNYPKRTAIHLDLDLLDENSKGEGSNQKLKWSKTEALISGDLTLSASRNNIEISRTGLYFVSPMIVFDDTKEDLGGPNLDPMLLQVYRVRRNEELLLLESRATHCANSDTKCSIPSSAQGVFKFEDGDNIVVKVTKPCGLVLKENINHFDMYLI